MVEGGSRGYGFILLTFFVAYVLAVVPLPDWLMWGRPEWVALTLVYWVIALPHRVGIATALVESLAGRAGALGFRRLLTSTGRGNRAMQAVASRLGFAATADWSYLLGPVPRVPSGQEVGA